jgi:hypothetical protein
MLSFINLIFFMLILSLDREVMINWTIATIIELFLPAVFGNPRVSETVGPPSPSPHPPHLSGPAHAPSL